MKRIPRCRYVPDICNAGDDTIPRSENKKKEIGDENEYRKKLRFVRCSVSGKRRKRRKQVKLQIREDWLLSCYLVSLLQNIYNPSHCTDGMCMNVWTAQMCPHIPMSHVTCTDGRCIVILTVKI